AEHLEGSVEDEEQADEAGEDTADPELHDVSPFWGSTSRRTRRVRIDSLRVFFADEDRLQPLERLDSAHARHVRLGEREVQAELLLHDARAEQERLEPAVDVRAQAQPLDGQRRERLAGEVDDAEVR